MTAQCFFICSPKLEQAFVIAKYIKKYKPYANIVGVTMPNELQPKNITGFNKIISFEQYVNSNSVGILIPTGAISTKTSLESIGSISLGSVTLATSSLSVFDKPWLLAQAKKIGIPTPKTWEKVENITKYPIFYKERYEKGGGTRGIANSQDKIPHVPEKKLIYQELINSPGTYGVSFLADQGNLLVTHSYFESESIPKDGGSAIVIENHSDELLATYTKKLIQGLGYSGWGVVEYKHCTQRNDYVLMEINAKFCASCEFTFLNKPDFLKLLFDIDCREKKPQKMLFLDRALLRGIVFTIINVKTFTGVDSIKLYPNWHVSFLKSLLPIKARFLFKKIKKQWRRYLA